MIYFSDFDATSGDPYWSDVVLLCGFEGTYANGAASAFAQDESSYARSGEVHASTSSALAPTSKFGAQAMRRTSSRQYISWADDTEWPNGTNPFTIEMWVQFTLAPTSGVHYLIGQYDVGNNNRSWALLVNAGSLQLLVSNAGTSGTTKASAAWAPSTGVWYHVAADWDGTDYRTYVDGVMLGKSATGVSLFDSSARVTLATVLSNGATSATFAFEGYIDEVRVTAGTARYASDSGYTVPTAAFPRS